MDEEAKQLLREIRDLLQTSGIRHAELAEHARLNSARTKLLMRIIIPVTVAAIAVVAWLILRIIPRLP